MPPLRIAVIGGGAFGRNHLRVYRELERADPSFVQLAALVEPDGTRRSALAAEYSIPSFAAVDELLATGALKGTGFSPSVQEAHQNRALAPEGAHIHAASICVPTIHHAAVAAQLLTAGIDVLIEKPFAATLAEADHVLALAAQHNRVLAIGHLERFNPAVTAAIAALNRPMFFEAHRLSVFTPRSLDVDVVLDLMIHDLDIVLALAQSPVREVRAVGLPVLSRKSDIANVRLEFASGCVANFTASRVSTEQVRKLRLFQPHQYLSLDFARQELLTISVDPQLAALAADPTRLNAFLAAQRAAGPSIPAASAPVAPVAQGPVPVSTAAPAHHPTAAFSAQKAGVPKGEPLRLELENFLHAVRTRTQPRVTGEAGRTALALALDINAHIAAHAHSAGLL